ncbi:hypothetical protein PCYB_141080 [Plasmodium cynomolgi strain B]|uniref:Uncharacterized protein n=1 Tax=Plasmodium cynomolgi (strain B) TaxID=1120755 RepID=K6UEN9_PLACD|nr:hypothetical protein PCYB_141080 [Plasmodium cynomolgi strain B]GAB68681.1 hypothetical protein PCYB_141080 [Plasmodium cynomolgi strain B]
MEDNHEKLDKSLSTEHEHTGTGRKQQLNIKISTFILFIKISVYALFICSLYYSNHGTFSKPRNTQCNQWNKPSLKSRALVEQGPAYINKYSKINEYSKLCHMHDDYPTFNEETYFRRDLAAFKSKWDKRTSQPLHNLISKIKSAPTNFLDEKRRSSEKGIENNGKGINIPNVVTKKPGRVIEEPVEVIEYHEATTEDPDEESIYFDAEIDEQEILDEEEQRLKNYLDSYLEDEIHLKNIHKFIQETEECTRKYKKKKYDFFKNIIALRKRFKKIINSIKHRLVKHMTYRKHHLIKLLIFTINWFFSKLLP